MEFKGTKEKWIVEYSDRDNSYDIVTKESFIASTLNASNESKVNALLISKAPEMLEMLEELLFEIKINDIIPTFTFNGTIQKAKQLIKEATEF